MSSDPRRNKEWLETAYQTKSIKEIAKELKVGYSTIYRDFIKFGISTRNRKEWLKLRPDTYTKILKENWSKPSYQRKMSESFSKQWNDPNYRKKMEKIAKEKWNDPKFNEKMAKIYQSKEYRQKQSKTLKKKWADINYQEKYQQKITTPEHKDKQSKASKEKWNDLNYRKKMMDLYATPEYKNKKSQKSKEKWNDPNYRKKMENIAKDPGKRAKASAWMKKKWADPDYQKKMAKIRSTIPKVTKIAKILYEYLDNLGIKYYREYNHQSDDPQLNIGPYTFDCIIPRENQPDLIIECQGDYWHNLKNNSRNNQAKATYINKYFKNQYEIKYLWEHEFKNKDRVIDLIQYWTRAKIQIIDFNFKEVVIMRIKAKTARPFLEKYHYLSGVGRGGIIYGAYFNQQLIAICGFSSHSRQNVATSLGLKSNSEFKELSRFCIHPKYQKKNFGSWLISRSIKKLKKDCPRLKLIISYCDITFNHNGVLYLASNFIQDKIVPSDYWYRSNNGWVCSKKKIYRHATSLRMTEKEFANKNGYQLIKGKEKYRFIYKFKQK